MKQECQNKAKLNIAHMIWGYLLAEHPDAANRPEVHDHGKRAKAYYEAQLNDCVCPCEIAVLFGRCRPNGPVPNATRIREAIEKTRR